MPTVAEINTAKAQLTPQPYTNNSALTADTVSTLHKFMRKYLYDRKQVGRYSDSAIAVNLAAAVGIDAAQLQAVLNNISTAGSKVAKLTGEVEYTTQETIDNEIEFAFMVLFVPQGFNTFGGSKQSDMAVAIRSGAFLNSCGCGDEYKKTRCKD